MLAHVELTRIIGGDAALLVESDIKHCTTVANPVGDAAAIGR